MTLKVGRRVRLAVELALTGQVAPAGETPPQPGARRGRGAPPPPPRWRRGLHPIGALFMTVVGAVYTVIGYRLVEAPFSLPQGV
ncbi:hypothetical protein ACFV0D_35765, partial [Streptomyces sp. NPDC059556]